VGCVRLATHQPRQGDAARMTIAMVPLLLVFLFFQRAFKG
jgi:hypothetical protein